VLSGIIAATNFFILYRYLTWALGELYLGAATIGAGVLEHRIKLPLKDELGELGHTFNMMAENLGEARAELTEANATLESRNKEVEAQRRVSDNLLLNILPEQIAEELRKNESVEPKYFEDVTILFTDFVGFTLSTEKMAADELVQVLNDYFTAFDQITSRYGIEKLKTIGDSYMCVAGMPVRSPSHPVDMVLAAFEMVHVVQQLSSRPGAPNWAVRVGVHTGPVISGVVGIHKFAFDVWGESVNYASRMESSGAANRVNLSERTHSRVKDFITCEYRGKVATKDRRELDMYFANGVLPELMDDPTQFPSPAFLRRYRTYFQKGPRAFPIFMAEQRAAAMEPVPGRY
jgi:class 3 adenylate cyclase/HAMP domain-containing protein